MLKNTDENIIHKFYQLSTRKDVADLLEIKEESLRYFLYSKKSENLYSTFYTIKKNGEKREINAPIKEWKNIQKKLAYSLNLVYTIKPSAHSFVNDKNIRTNAQNHIKRKLILNIDLKDFFNQIHFGRIRGMLTSKPYSIGLEAATTIAQIACHNSVLPQGAPSSPIITNMVCSPLDTKLMSFAKKHNIRYSRYADDITLSTFENKFNSKIINDDFKNLKLGKHLEYILNESGFEVNEKKIFLNDYKVRQEVTGLIVNRFVNVKREYIKNLRAILHSCKQNGIYNTAQIYIKKGYCRNKNIENNKNKEEYKDKVILWFKFVLKGKLNFISDIRGRDDNLFLKYAEQLNKLFNEKIFDTNKLKKYNEDILKNIVIIEKNDHTRQGTGFLLKNIGLVTCYHVTKCVDFYNVYKNEEYDHTIFSVISKDMNEISSNEEIDYAFYKVKVTSENCLEIGDSTNLCIGDEVTIIGFPSYGKGSSPTVQTCNIIGEKFYLGSKIHTISASVFHGASGGAVLNKQNKVIGIIKGGVQSTEEEQSNVNQGFVPFHLAYEHFNNTVKKTSTE